MKTFLDGNSLVIELGNEGIGLILKVMYMNNEAYIYSLIMS